MNEYICVGCGNSVEGEEKPEKCPHCDAGADKLNLIENEKIEVKEEHKTTGSTVLGIRGTPSEMTQLLNMVLLPISGNKTFYKKAVLNIGDKKTTNFAMKEGGIMVSIIELENSFLGEVWGEGQLPLIGEKTNDKISMLSMFNSLTIQADVANKVITHNAGANAKFADNYEDPEYVTTNFVPTDEKPYPVPILEDFLPGKPGEESMFKYKATIDTTSLKLLFSAASKYGIKFFPMTFSKEELRAGVGDMLNPVDGAFDIEIPLKRENSVLPTEPISVEVGPGFQYLMENLSDEATIHFAQSNFPIWITVDITKKKDKEYKSFGRAGYMITPKTETE